MRSYARFACFQVSFILLCLLLVVAMAGADDSPSPTDSSTFYAVGPSGIYIQVPMSLLHTSLQEAAVMDVYVSSSHSIWWSLLPPAYTPVTTSSPALLLHWRPDAFACPPAWTFIALVRGVQRVPPLSSATYESQRPQGFEAEWYRIAAVCESPLNHSRIGLFHSLFMWQPEHHHEQQGSFMRRVGNPQPVVVFQPREIGKLLLSSPASSSLSGFTALSFILVYQHSHDGVINTEMMEVTSTATSSAHPVRTQRLDAPWLSYTLPLTTRPHFVCYSAKFRVAALIWRDNRSASGSLLHVFHISNSGSATLLYETAAETLVSEDAPEEEGAERFLPSMRFFESCRMEEETGGEAFRLQLTVEVVRLKGPGGRPREGGVPSQQQQSPVPSESVTEDWIGYISLSHHPRRFECCDLQNSRSRSLRAMPMRHHHHTAFLVMEEQGEPSIITWVPSAIRWTPPPTRNHSSPTTAQCAALLSSEWWRRPSPKFTVNLAGCRVLRMTIREAGMLFTVSFVLFLFAFLVLLVCRKRHPPGGRPLG